MIYGWFPGQFLFPGNVANFKILFLDILGNGVLWEIFSISNILLNHWAIEFFPNESNLSTEIAGLFRTGMVAILLSQVYFVPFQ